MRASSEQQLRRSFVNCSKGEANAMTLPRTFAATPWEELVVLGWRDAKAPLRGYLVVEREGSRVSVALRAADTRMRSSTSVMCLLCQTARSGADGDGDVSATVLPGHPAVMTDPAPLRALALVCSLKPTPAPSSTDLIARQVLDALAEHGVTGETVRVVDHDVRPGVEIDMGDGDEWPGIREKLMAADVLVFSTPTWVGHMSSVAQRVLERLDGELSETDDTGRPLVTGKVAVVAVVGNEDGAHKITADAFQGLSDIGFTIPAQGATYWNGEAMQGVDYNDLDETPEAVDSTTTTLAANAAHLARVLKTTPYSTAG